MKDFKISFLIIAMLVLATGCNRDKELANNEAAAVAQDTVVAEEAPLKSITVTGIVQQLNRGKDGYTAELKDFSDSLFFATVSHSNLKDAAQYRDSKLGDTLNVTGESFFMEGHTYITVRELK